MPASKARQSGLRAEKRSFSRSTQPLKPVNRKASRVVFGALLLIGCLIVAVTQYDSVMSGINRPISKIRIENQWRQVNEIEVSAALAEFMGTGFFNFNVRSAKEKLEEMPWVEFVSVKRIWPDTLSLALQEEVAIAKWGESSYLNQSGEVINPNKPSVNQSLPVLVGPEGSQVEVMQQYQRLNQLLFPEGLRLTELSYSQRGSWDLVLNEAIRVSTGKSEVFERVTRLVGFLNSRPDIELAEIASVDLRYNNGFAVKTIQQELSGVAAR